ncbi:glycosyltransferase family 2 protein [Chelatococcus daeguensis]|uniref:glycosyltransferase family 2 protein n=1 Tax=Chelatococcus daeguensis TaxID=444444 RepID=UPI0007AC07E6|nr:glycosyltransferase family 2 protein [Chelatococcus daeguensis]KZE36646.1 glycosyl transferase [Chelatococcus daeguensis]MBM3082263.1 glycosyltransferase family 2 protein [Chelatococcus daeguensis]
MPLDASAVTAVVVTHDSAHCLPACLAAVAACGAAAIVVDNASRDGSTALAEHLGARVIRSARNEGYGRASNIGVRAAASEFVLIVNPDLVLDAGAVKALLAAAERYPDAGLLAPRIEEADGRFFFQPRSLLSPYLHNRSGRLVLPEGDCCAPFLSGAALFCRRDLFLELGGFDEAIFLFYEDDDLCRRMADSGRALIHVDAARAMHGRGRSSAPEPGRIFRSRWHQAWSRAYVSRKYGLPDPAFGMFAVNALKAAGACLTFNRRLIERYGGSAAGAWAWLTGRGALAREGLD